jgi:hypothetical protein
MQNLLSYIFFHPQKCKQMGVKKFIVYGKNLQGQFNNK